MATAKRIVIGSFLLACACGSKDEASPVPPAFGGGIPDDTGGTGGTGDDTGGTGDDTGGPPDLSICEQLGLTARDFDPESSDVPKRHAPAGDFTLPLVEGSEWTLSEHWTGCESYIFLPHWLPVDEADNRTWWSNGIDGIFEKSPPNVHYFFIVAGEHDSPEDFTGPLADSVAENLARLDDDDAAWWSDRLHVVAAPSAELSGFVKKAFQGNIGQLGFAVDRFGAFRTLGSMAAVEAYDSALGWPWGRRIYDAGYQPEYYNFEADREERLAAEDALVIEVLTGEEYAEYQDGILVLPDNIADFDTLEIDVVMECPNTNGYELGNCGAWDYLAYMWLWEDPPATDGSGKSEDGEVDTGDGDTGEIEIAEPDTGEADTGEAEEPPPPTGQWHEMARFITTYHREARWVIDASHALAWLGEGGSRTVRFEWAPAWNTQPTLITTRFRFSNRAKTGRPVQITHLYTGGSFNSSYNSAHPALEVDVPSDVSRVELVAITTVHGMDDGNCAEFCDHAHTFNINGSEFVQNLDDPGLSSGCADKVGEGVVPNQGGTWWFGRGGWCPGARVDPFVIDVTELLTPGETASVLYQATREGGEPTDGSGNIKHNSWLVFHR